ncbi:MAG: hypothetical protein MUQ26_02885, partial [Armatimonadetes bacterium]|nr:hypothetical protein [Armatimonadota bacterium]
LDSPPTAGTTFTRADTGEFRRDWQTGVAVIDAPRSQGAFGRLEDAGTVRTSDVSVRSETPFAAIVVTSMDGRPVRESRHLLVTAVGRAENTGQVFNMTRTELKQLGVGPILVEPVTGRVTISTNRDAFTAYALDADGTRRSLGERRALSDAITLDITQASRTIYYELESVE